IQHHLFHLIAVLQPHTLVGALVPHGGRVAVARGEVADEPARRRRGLRAGGLRHHCGAAHRVRVRAFFAVFHAWKEGSWTDKTRQP
ncbi:unnamed protein product, partial [Plutella xylostella]